MRRFDPLLVSLVVSIAMVPGTSSLAGAEASAAGVVRKALPEVGCDLVDAAELSAALGAPVGEPSLPEGAVDTAESVGCELLIPYDRATCGVNPPPAVRVIVGVPEGGFDVETMRTTADLLEAQGSAVIRLKGKAYGKKGAYIAGSFDRNFTGFKGRYAILVGVNGPCDVIPPERLLETTKIAARRVVRSL